LEEDIVRTMNAAPGLRIIQEYGYIPESADNIRKYAEAFKTVPDRTCHTTAYGFEKSVGGTKSYPLVILGFGGASLLKENSFVVRDNRLYLAVDDHVLSLELGSLRILWSTKVDSATCFGIYWMENDSCFISWGEMEISKVDQNGNIKWSVAGKDIFSNGFKIVGGFAIAIDFENNEYKIELDSGKLGTTPYHGADPRRRRLCGYGRRLRDARRY
jgi:hypothetical protein